MPFIIYPQLPSNKLAVVIPAADVNDCIKDVPEGVEYAIVDDLSYIDNEYFDGYIYSDRAAIPDIAACKNIHLDKFRAARSPKLAALDVAFMRAVEQGDATKQEEIAAQKQELRDVTKIALPNTLPEIKAIWPDILGTRPSTASPKP
jgi:hypothetical protein